MKVAVIGGTGDMGGAIAAHLAKKHEVIIGSRDLGRAEEAAKSIPGATAADYLGAATRCEIAVIAVPFSAMASIGELAEALAGKLVISIVNPLRFEGGYLHYGLERGSAAEELASMLPNSRVATAFNNVPVAMMKLDPMVAIDILVAATSEQAYEEAAELVKSVENLRPLYAGPISEAEVVERITPLVLNLAKWNQTGSLATRFPSREG
jgi:NADPH-dependent F420 reductase